MGNLLEIKDLRVQYETSDGIVKALNGIDLSLEEGMTLGLVGETGAGKTTLAKSIMRIIPQPPGKIVSGEILYDGNDILQMDKPFRLIAAVQQPDFPCLVRCGRQPFLCRRVKGEQA